MKMGNTAYFKPREGAALRIKRLKACLNHFIIVFLLAPFAFLTLQLRAESGYDLWLRYTPSSNNARNQEVANAFANIVVAGDSKTATIIRAELSRAKSQFAKNVLADNNRAGTVLIGTPANLPEIRQFGLEERLSRVGTEGFVIISTTQTDKHLIIVAANTDIGALYGTYDLLRLVMTGHPLDGLNLDEQPAINRRVLDHWDNLDGSVERGYAGKSLWKWSQLPDTRDPRYEDYARANASIGINGVVLNNVNADARILSKSYLVKVAALADCFRPYGIHVYLAANFGAPLASQKQGEIKTSGIGSLNTADPSNPAVQAWWSAKVGEIYQLIPDFGGFLVKADSEGMPGPQDYGKTHADGANMLADILAPHGGVVMWRAFVYPKEADPDRAKREYIEFQPFDGKFHRNVLLQVKYGPLDFQPDEPFNPLFGAMPHTPLMLELEITQEYMGHEDALVFLAPLWSKVLNADTWSQGGGSTIAKVISGELEGHSDSGIAGVANVGTDTNWCGSDFAQANWYAFGRLAWEPSLQPESIAREWIQQTWTDDPMTIEVIDSILKESWPAVVDYTAPLGLQFTMASKDHYSPDPQGRVGKLWKADKDGIGYDRTSAGSSFVSQYQNPVEEVWSSLERCPDSELLFFHYVPWEYSLHSGRTVLPEFDYRFNRGVETVGQIAKQWETLRGKIDPERFGSVGRQLNLQFQDACNWRDTYLTFLRAARNEKNDENGLRAQTSKTITE
jgi:alpha-glucuronidase